MSSCSAVTNVSRRRTTLPAALALFVLLSLVTAATSRAQTGYSSFGTRFIVAFPDTTMSHTRILYNRLENAATLTLVSLDTARVTVSSPGYIKTVTVLPDRSTSITLTDPSNRAPKIFVDAVGIPQPTTFDVRSDRPVAVTAYFSTIHGTEAFTPLPVAQWDREYFAASLNQWFVYNALAIEEKYTFVAAPAALLVVASEDNTEVTIEAKSLVTGPPTRTITLNAGQVYLVETGVPAALDSLAKPDLSGTRIIATKPIGVLSGNTRTLGSSRNPIPPEPLPTNAMSNAAFEWLHPVSSHGHTFIYRPFSAVDEIITNEIVRVYATSPGFTTVTLTHGPPMGILQGEYLEFQTRDWRVKDTVLQPFGIRTDKPAQAFVVTGSSATLIGNKPEDSVEMVTTTWSPAMAELEPRERWITLGRYNAPLYPGGYAHYVVVAADSGATVLLDGQPVAFDPVPVIGTSYRHARVSVTPGDHTLRSTGGRFTATAYGQRRGYAAFRPFAVKGDDESGDGVAMHPTYYLETLAYTYAMPVPGFSDLKPPTDSLEISRLDRCDSTVVTANRRGVTWSSSIIDATLDAGSRNASVAITKTFNNKLHIGFRIRFMPVDPSQDADAVVTITNDAGQRWTIPWSYSAHTVALDPATIELLAIDAGTTQTIPLTLTNRKPFTTTVLDVRLLDGTQGFTLLGRSVLPKPLASGASFQLTLSFTGAEPGKLYRDTILIVSDCDTMHVPITARTSPPEPQAIPLITGYDWGVRRVASVSDTLSFVSNAGTLPFTADRIVVIDDPAGAFSVQQASPLPVVEPAARHSVGIRFVPPSEGTFVATILLVTTDGDSARAELRGVALLARVDIDDLVLPPLCIGQALDTFVMVRASGSAATRIDSFVVAGSPLVRIELDTAWMGLPLTLAPGDSLRLRLRLIALGAGTLDAAVVVHAAATGDTIARIGAEAITCATPGITATDHDFGTVLISLTRLGVVHVINTGEGDVTVRGMRIVDDAGNAFAIVGPPTPVVIPEGDSMAVEVSFTPPAIAAWSARVEYETTAGIVYSRLTGIGEALVVPAHIPRGYRGAPGSERRIAVMLDRSAYVAGAGPIPVSVEYDAELFDFIELYDTAAAITGLRLVASSRGRVDLELLPTGDSLLAGPIAALRFLVRISLADSTELPLAMTSPVPWLSFETSPGLFVRDPWCGLTERLFEFTVGELALRPIRPNPVRGSATIEFGVPVDGVVRLSIVDALGVERLRVVDNALAAGGYAAAIPAGAVPRGAYLARLEIAGMQRVITFVVE
jgi:hypothetical protein